MVMVRQQAPLVSQDRNLVDEEGWCIPGKRLRVVCQDESLELALFTDDLPDKRVVVFEKRVRSRRSTRFGNQLRCQLTELFVLGHYAWVDGGRRCDRENRSPPPATLDDDAEERVETLFVRGEQEDIAHKYPDIRLPAPDEEAQVVVRCVTPPASRRSLINVLQVVVHSPTQLCAHEIVTRQ